MSSCFLYNPDGAGNFCHSPNLLACRDGSLLAVWYAYPKEEHQNGKIVLAKSVDNGRSWSKSKMIAPLTGYSCGNPVLYEDGDHILLFYVLIKGSYWSDAEIHSAETCDKGETWTSIGCVRSEKGAMVKHPPVKTANNTLLLPIYLERSETSHILRYTGIDWEMYGNMAMPHFIQPLLVSLDSRNLLAFFRPTSPNRSIFRSASWDSGKSWSEPVDTGIPNPFSAIGGFIHEQSIYLVSNHTQEHKRTPLCIDVSSDKGVTWNGPFPIDSIEGEISYPSFVVTKEGTAAGVYTYNRRMIKFVSFRPNEFHQEGSSKDAKPHS